MFIKEFLSGTVNNLLYQIMFVLTSTTANNSFLIAGRKDGNRNYVEPGEDIWLYIRLYENGDIKYFISKNFPFSSGTGCPSVTIAAVQKKEPEIKIYLPFFWFFLFTIFLIISMLVARRAPCSVFHNTSAPVCHSRQCRWCRCPSRFIPENPF